MDRALEFTQADLDIRFHVQLGFSIVVGAYEGPITRATLSEHITRMIADNGPSQFIDKIEIIELALDSGPVIATAEGSSNG